MASIPNPFALLARAVRAFFTADLKLRRSGRGLVVEFGGRSTPDLGREPAPVARGRRAAGPSSSGERELRQIRASLATLLDAHHGSRHALRHLAFMAQAIDRDGLRAIDKVPHEVLQRALEQLEGLVSNWSDAGLAALRSKMSVSLRQRQPSPAAAPAPETPAALNDDDIDADAPLSHPIPLDGDEAAEAEAALLAAYGSMAIPGLANAEPAPATAPRQPVH